MNVIEVENISKKYSLGEFTGKRYWQELSQSFIRQEIDDQNVLWALKDINFSLKQGDVLALVGSNGAGKSTLLKLISRITAPTTGSIRYYGSLGSLLELGAGFHPELTGRENIYLSGSILGMTRADIKKSLDDIVDFSGISLHLDTPIRRYSSGMIIKLAFSISAYLRANLLLYDEVLAVADYSFREKALNKISEMVKNEGKTAIFVSHNQAQLKALCNKGLILDHGNQHYFGNFQQALDQYQAKKGIDLMTSINWTAQPPTLGAMTLLAAKLVTDEFGEINYSDKIILQFELLINEYIKSPFFDFKIYNDNGQVCFHSSFNQSNGFVASETDKYKLTCELASEFLNPGDYYVDMTLFESGKPNALNLPIKDSLVFRITEKPIIASMPFNYWQANISPEQGRYTIEKVRD